MAMELKRVYEKSKNTGRQQESRKEKQGSSNGKSDGKISPRGNWKYQFLTGRGYFREYLHKYDHDDETNCFFRGSNGLNTLHILFSCSGYENEGADLEQITMDRATSENIGQKGIMDEPNG